MSAQEYSLKFIMLSKYSYSLVSNPRYEMIHLVNGVSDNLVEESMDAMFH